jgi:opacity protein-like surface antigen
MQVGASGQARCAPFPCRPTDGLFFPGRLLRSGYIKGRHPGIRYRADKRGRGPGAGHENSGARKQDSGFRIARVACARLRRCRECRGIPACARAQGPGLQGRQGAGAAALDLDRLLPRRPYRWRPRAQQHHRPLWRPDLRRPRGTPGPIAGVQAGFNHQVGDVVFGMEADISFADMDGTNTCFAVGAHFYSANCRAHTRDLGTVAARLGWAVQPRTLLYGKAGAAWTREHLGRRRRRRIRAHPRPGRSSSNTTISASAGTMSRRPSRRSVTASARRVAASFSSTLPLPTARRRARRKISSS